jgi:ribonucleoside-diphosphate reductase alpha chain
MPTPLTLSPNAIQVLERRYLRKGEDGATLETPEQMFRRVARNIASVNERYGDRQGEEEEFFEAMMALEFLPNSPTLMNAGTRMQQLSACFVLPVEDSIESIYDAIKYAAIVQQTGGGTGYSFSRLRPEGDEVGSTGGIASGPVSFMRVFDAATESIKQGGRRRGANMGVLRVDHPDIEKFIHAKEDLTSFSNFNLSVAVTDEFMERAVEGESYDLINPRTRKAVRSVSASYILERVATSAWRSGDPGVL